MEKNKFKVRVLCKTDKEAAEQAVMFRGGNDCLDWYVLVYDTKTNDYKNEIEFQTLADAIEKFNRVWPEKAEERVELMFAPEEEDSMFKDNIVVNYKYGFEEEYEFTYDVLVWNYLKNGYETLISTNNRIEATSKFYDKLEAIEKIIKNPDTIHLDYWKKIYDGYVSEEHPVQSIVKVKKVATELYKTYGFITPPKKRNAD